MAHLQAYPVGQEKLMKLVLIFIGALVATSCISAQSPAATEAATIGGKTITIRYSSPRLRGRAGKLFGKDGAIGHDSTYPVWRAGANAATRLQTEADLDLGGLAVPKGEYSLYVDLSNPDAWQLIVNKETGQSGTAYNQSKDLGRVKMAMSKPPAPIENLKYTISASSGNAGKLTLEWENRSASVPITVK
jgi:hypothetical protein